MRCTTRCNHWASEPFDVTDPITLTESGTAFVRYGSASGMGAARLPANAGWRAEGPDASSYFGVSVGTAGDVNGDGRADVIAGAAQPGDYVGVIGRAYGCHGQLSPVVFLPVMLGQYMPGN